MCGVIGIINKNKPVASELLIGMLSLQHRGQDGCGIITFDNNTHHIKKGEGLVQNFFNDRELKEFKGNVGIGHTRYRTAGSASNKNLHPFLVSSTKKVAMVENGNITNYHEIKEKLKQKGVFLETTTDIEPITKIFAYEFEMSSNIFYSASQLMKKIRGGYSLVGIVENFGLFAIRDPHGIKPLMLGKKNDSYCLASESITFQCLGYEFVRDVYPGEVILIDNNLNITTEIIKEQPHTPCMFEWVYFARPDSKLDERSVNNARLKLGELIAQRWEKEIDVVIPVPDTSRTAAIKFAETLGVKYREGLIKNRYIGRTFIMPTQELRESSVRLKLNPILSIIENKRIALFDDSIVRGTTARKIISMLKENGAREIHLVSTCPPITHPCFYGVNMPSKQELIASSKSIEEIRQELGADSLTYATLNEIKQALKKTSLCMACLDGNYPTDISEEEKLIMASPQDGC